MVNPNSNDALDRLVFRPQDFSCRPATGLARSYIRLSGQEGQI